MQMSGEQLLRNIPFPVKHDRKLIDIAVFDH